MQVQELVDTGNDMNPCILEPTETDEIFFHYNLIVFFHYFYNLCNRKISATVKGSNQLILGRGRLQMYWSDTNYYSFVQTKSPPLLPFFLCNVKHVLSCMYVQIALTVIPSPLDRNVSLD